MRKRPLMAPLRVAMPDAAAMLGVQYGTIRRLVSEGTLTAIRPRGKGVGKPVYLDTHEVKLYAAGQFEELQAYQAKRKGGKS